MGGSRGLKPDFCVPHEHYIDAAEKPWPWGNQPIPQFEPACSWNGPLYTNTMLRLQVYTRIEKRRYTAIAKLYDGLLAASTMILLDISRLDVIEVKDIDNYDLWFDYIPVDTGGIVAVKIMSDVINAIPPKYIVSIAMGGAEIDGGIVAIDAESARKRCTEIHDYVECGADAVIVKDPVISNRHGGRWERLGTWLLYRI